MVTSGAITGIFVFILNKAIENKFDMKLEAYKDKLKSESDKELMQLTNDLELKASERNIKLTGIFNRQSEIVAITHHNLIVFYRDFQDATEALGLDPKPFVSRSARPQGAGTAASSLNARP
jgi:hypothetical protein